MSARVGATARLVTAPSQAARSSTLSAASMTLDASTRVTRRAADPAPRPAGDEGVARGLAEQDREQG
jgi:hypothetical protein